MRTGEGRVEVIKALIDAERDVRPVTGVIVFDRSKRIRWRSGVTAPGYDGVGGLFAQLLGDPRFTAFAALSSEMYITYDETDPLPPRIASFIESELMAGEIAEAIFGLVTQGLDLSSDVLETLHDQFFKLLQSYVASLRGVRAKRLGEFRHHIITPLQRTARQFLTGSTLERFLSRLGAGNVHLEGLVTTFFDYAELAESFRHARIGEIEQVSGARRKFFIVSMSSGRRKQLMYDLTSRIVDADSLPVNLVIVSTWARTGWNVLKPNVLIDATATRDVTAWQQLRGRAIRSLRTWTNDCYRALVMVRSSGSIDGDAPTNVDDATVDLFDTAPDRLQDLLRAGRLDTFTDEERNGLVTGLFLNRNKVTHIYELVKAAGSTKQIEFDRASRTWRRHEAIERKHAYESAVDVFGGAFVSGVEHAPMVYAKDPRNDLPEDLKARVSSVIENRDGNIVLGWLGASEH
jgi:hypothetical protein